MKSAVACRETRATVAPEARGLWDTDGPDPRDEGEIEAALRLTRHPDPRVRREAVHELCPCRLKANHQEVWDSLMAMAADEDAKVHG